MDGCLGARDVTVLSDGKRRSSTAASSETNEESAPHHHSGPSTRKSKGVNLAGDYNTAMSPTGSSPSRRRRHACAHSNRDAQHDILFSDDDYTGPRLIAPQSCSLPGALHVACETNPNIIEDRQGSVEESLLSVGEEHGGFLDRCVRHKPHAQRGNAHEGGGNSNDSEARNFCFSHRTSTAFPTSPFNVTSAALAMRPPSPADNRRPSCRLSMQESEMPADPRTRLLGLVMANATAGITLAEMQQQMNWNAEYAATYGPLLEYLQSYQSIFVVSPVDDRVRLRRPFHVHTTARSQNDRRPAYAASSRVSPWPAHQRHGRRTDRYVGHPLPSVGERRSGKLFLSSAEALAAQIGSVSYSCVAERLNLGALEAVYHRRGYKTEIVHSVLHVSSEHVFDLFLFSNGTVVWWGMDRKDHWIVDDDFLSPTNRLLEGVEHRHAQAEIDALFPIWCSYELDTPSHAMSASSPLGLSPLEIGPAVDRLAKALCFDHYLVPISDPLHSLVMLTFSHSLGRSARVHYFEFVTKALHDDIMSIPAEFSGLVEYYSTKRRIARIEGELAEERLAIQSIHDTPDVLWEAPWLQGYYDMAEKQNTTESRLLWLTSRCDTLLEQLIHIKGRRHRLFMLGSDVFLIVLLLLDVLFMTSRLVSKLYFKVESES
ncbi:hypothetical protein JKF63_03006 [Porcisia hertigi]|uniref:DUF155 domain-containing protein n=1 Tax=Porcisia hertigi TaxID=2761500 RepID=A0A836ING1_9TRYP|nr:hypothetical protein JKF63_03006 [Porcisia hertigi]